MWEPDPQGEWLCLTKRFNEKQSVLCIKPPHVIKMLGQMTLVQCWFEGMLLHQLLLSSLELFLGWNLLSINILLVAFKAWAPFSSFRTVFFWPVVFNRLLGKLLFLSRSLQLKSLKTNDLRYIQHFSGLALWVSIYFVHTRVSQPRHYWHVGLDRSLRWGLSYVL